MEERPEDYLEGVKTPEYRVSLEEYKEFFESNIWLDLLDYLEARYIIAGYLMDKAETIEEMKYLQGARRELSILMSIDKIFIADMEYEEEKAQLNQVKEEKENE